MFFSVTQAKQLNHFFQKYYLILSHQPTTNRERYIHQHFVLLISRLSKINSNNIHQLLSANLEEARRDMTEDDDVHDCLLHYSINGLIQEIGFKLKRIPKHYKLSVLELSSIKNKMQNSVDNLNYFEQAQKNLAKTPATEEIKTHLDAIITLYLQEIDYYLCCFYIEINEYLNEVVAQHGFYKPLRDSHSPVLISPEALCLKKEKPHHFLGTVVESAEELTQEFGTAPSVA